MIKVLMLGNHPSNKGGMTSVISQIREHDWIKADIDLSFIPTFFPGNPAKKMLGFVGAYLKIVGMLLFSRPDIVHMHMSYKGSFTRKYCIHRLCRIFGVKDIIHLHGSEFEKWYNEVNSRKKHRIRRLLSECDAFIVLGDQWKSVIQKIEPLVNVSVIHNGIAIPDKTVAWDSQCCRILFLGVLIQRKGVSDLIKAIGIVRDRGFISGKHFVIAGTGNEENALRTQVREAALSEYVSFTGWVAGEEKKNLIESCQIMVLPSYNEGLPISLLEAASYGMPVIATAVGDISSVINNNINGVLLQPGDIDELADALIHIASEPVFRQMSIEARNTITNRFSIEAFYRKLSDLYHQVQVQEK